LIISFHKHLVLSPISIQFLYYILKFCGTPPHCDLSSAPERPAVLSGALLVQQGPRAACWDTGKVSELAAGQASEWNGLLPSVTLTCAANRERACWPFLLIPFARGSL